MEEITLPSGRKVTLNLNASTLTRAFDNPYLPAVQKLYEGYLEVRGMSEAELGDKIAPGMMLMGNYINYFKAMNEVIKIVCHEPRFYSPGDPDVPEGAESLDDLEDRDRLNIFWRALEYLGSLGAGVMLPFREDSGSPAPG